MDGSFPYTLELQITFIATSIDGKCIGRGQTEEEAVERLEKMMDIKSKEAA